MVTDSEVDRELIAIVCRNSREMESDFWLELLMLWASIWKGVEVWGTPWKRLMAERAVELTCLRHGPNGY
jgi:hypothetical protein